MKKSFAATVPILRYLGAINVEAFDNFLSLSIGQKDKQYSVEQPVDNVGDPEVLTGADVYE